MAVKLNLGSGQFPKKGWTNIDIQDQDLNAKKWKWKSNSVDEIEADHVFEHLQDPFHAMKECHRILKTNGTLSIRVPHFSRGFTHADHKRGFDLSFPLYFNPAFKGGYSGVPFKCEKVELHWFAQPYLKKDLLSKGEYWFGLAGGKFFDVLARASPAFCSRVWCFWVGGFEEVEFVFRKV